MRCSSSSTETGSRPTPWASSSTSPTSPPGSTSGLAATRSWQRTAPTGSSRWLPLPTSSSSPTAAASFPASLRQLASLLPTRANTAKFRRTRGRPLESPPVEQSGERDDARRGRGRGCRRWRRRRVRLHLRSSPRPSSA
ncbi:Os11g0310566 [Oryza sativa Japonica Group]|uniref:Os11g0310566 protein n=1 Tax=Oryza sativa subsp. japonica TaxID=39947 RepID=A0A0P0Y1C9_ORYSJ|nr:Os11g0310566 [Oryza sativa Japonica Group]